MTVVDAVHRPPRACRTDGADPITDPADPARSDLDRLLSTARTRQLAVAQIRAADRDRHGVLEADLLVSPDHVRTLEQHLVARGFRRRPGWGRAPHRFWVRPIATASGAVDWLKVDLVTDLCFGPDHEIATGSAEACLARRVASRLDPADELGALLLHGLLDRGRLRPSQRARLVELAALRPGPGPLSHLCTSPGSAAPTWDGVLDLIEGRAWPTLYALAPTLRRRAVTVHPARVVRYRLRNVAGRKLAKGLTAVLGRGPLVALVGPDGTGKSTLAGHLTTTAGVPAVVVYGGTYRSGEATSSVPGLATAKVFTRLLAARADIVRHRGRGRLVVLDRHPVQARPRPEDRLPVKARLRRRVLAATLPDPDLYLVLDAPADVLHQRRPEHPVHQLERDRTRHLDLLGDDAAVRLDATATTEQVRARAIGLIWDRALSSGCR